MPKSALPECKWDGALRYVEGSAALSRCITEPTGLK